MTGRLARMILLAGAALSVARAEGGKTFATPEEARDALVQAAQKGFDEVRVLFGPSSAGIVRTGDEVADKNVLTRFNTLAAEKTRLEPEDTNPDQMNLLVGVVEWPFAVPLIRKNGRWSWDIEEGKTEIRRRTIGENELNAIEICRGYVEAQKTYSETDWDGNGTLEYAQQDHQFRRQEGRPVLACGDSPVAAGFAKAVAEGYAASAESPKPYHGYFYKILLAQGTGCGRWRTGICCSRTDDWRLRPGCLAGRVRRFGGHGVHCQSGWSCLREESRTTDQRTSEGDDDVQSG